MIVTVTAPNYSLTVSKSGTGTGTVASSPAGVNCGNNCNVNFDKDNSITLTAIPNSGSQFGGWTGCTSASGNACTVFLNSSRTITANFKPATVTSVVLPITGLGSQIHCDSMYRMCGCSNNYGSGAIDNKLSGYASSTILTNYGYDCVQPNGTVQDTSFKFALFTDLTATITKVHLTAKGAGSGGYPANGNLYYRSPLGANYYMGSSDKWSSGAVSLPATGATMDWDLPNNPSTGAPWRLEDLNASEFGLNGNCGMYGMYFNFLTLTVYYSDP
jgi:hypothetical protein